MNTKKFRVTAWVRGGLGLVVLLLLTGCVGSPRWGKWSHSPKTGQYTTDRAQADQAARR